MTLAGARHNDRRIALASGALVFAGVLWCVPAASNDRYAGLIDPTRPTVPNGDAEPVYSGPILQSTMIAPGFKRAVISGKTYVVGDRLGVAVISDIHAYEVILKQDGRESRLRLVPVLGKGTSAAAGRN